MSSLLDSNRVTVYVGDGFKFLAENTLTYDVIITDSSDPVGPAASLFQKPYFQLIHDALTPSGQACAQGECMWLHLPLISELRKTTGGIFPVVEYAFTTIPTYPSGQIGFTMMAKEKGRDMKIPLRKVPSCRYYNDAVHRAAFVLPEFLRASLEEGKDILPVLKPTATTGATKKILLLGSGFVARPCAEYVVRRPNNVLTIGEFAIALLNLFNLLKGHFKLVELCLPQKLLQMDSPMLRPLLWTQAMHKLWRMQLGSMTSSYL